MIHESAVPMLRCRVESEHLDTSVHYVPELEYDAWRQEMEGTYGRQVTIDEVSSWVAKGPAVERSKHDPNTRWPVARIHFRGCTRLGAPLSRIQFLASDSFQVRAARLAGLEVTPGFFVSALPFIAALEAFDEADAHDEELLAAIA